MTLPDKTGPAKKGRGLKAFNRQYSGPLSGRKGFTLLELLVVMFLISLILGMSAVFVTTSLPSSRLNATAREVAASIRQAKTLAQIKGRKQVLMINLDEKKFVIKGRSEKTIPPDIRIKIIDPLSGEISDGEYPFVFHAIGGAEGGTIVLWNRNRTAEIKTDPIVGSVVIK